MLKKLTLMVILFIILVSCSQNSPKLTVNKFMESVKKMDFKEANKYTKDNFFLKLDIEEGDKKDVLKEMLNNIKYDILDVTFDNEEKTSANVDLHIISPDIKKIFLENTKSSIINIFTGGKEDKRLQESIIETLKSEDCPVNEFDINLKLIKLENDWIIEDTGKIFFNAITGSLL